MSDFIDDEMRAAVIELAIGRLALVMKGLSKELKFERYWEDVLAAKPPAPASLTPEEVHFQKEVLLRAQILLTTGVPHLARGTLQ